MILGLLGIYTVVQNMPTSAKICLSSEPGDSRSFGNALAIDGKYLAIGDPEANRVVLYYQQAYGEWSRAQEIYPPPGSPTATVGSGFGYDLSLGGNVLVIGAYAEKRKPLSKEGFQWTNQLGVSFSGGVYTVAINESATVQRIDASAEGEISGFSVAVDKDKVAFGVRKENQRGQWIGEVRLLANGRLERITSPAGGSAQNFFGMDIALNQHQLLVAAPFDGMGAAWLFNLNVPSHSPRRLAVPGARIGSSVAMSDQFVVVGTRRGLSSAGPLPKTLVMELTDGSTTTIDGVGTLALADHLLARAHPTSADNEQRARLELFDLTHLSTPKLVDQRWGVSHAQLTDNLLVSVQEIEAQETRSNGPICIEQRT